MLIPESLLKLMSPADRRQFGRAGWSMADVQERVDLRLERKEHNIVTAWCRRHEIPCVHSATHKRPTNNIGLPDFIILYANHALPGEMKIGRRKLSESQQRMVAELRAARTDVQIWPSATAAIQAIQAWLESLGWQKTL
jgi:hypothetical protein